MWQAYSTNQSLTIPTPHTRTMSVKREHDLEQRALLQLNRKAGDMRRISGNTAHLTRLDAPCPALTISPRIPVPLWASGGRSSACRAVPPGMRVDDFAAGKPLATGVEKPGSPTRLATAIERTPSVIPVRCELTFTTGAAFIARRTDEGCLNQARQHQSSRVIPVPVINSRSRQHSKALSQHGWPSLGESGDVKAAIRTLSVAGNAAVVDAAPRFNFTHSPCSFRALSEAQQWGVGEDLR